VTQWKRNPQNANHQSGISVICSPKKDPTFRPAPAALFNGSCFLATANFLIFGVVSLFIGGDALNGHAEYGRFFLSNHGKLIEVSGWVFFYSGLHALSLFITFPLAALCVVALYRRHRPQGSK
jgi:hypothetical protein